MNKVLELEEVSRTFSSGVFRTHTVRAVDRVSFALERGKTFGLVGNSGCGKTTLSRMITRVLKLRGAHPLRGGGHRTPGPEGEPGVPPAGADHLPESGGLPGPLHAHPGQSAGGHGHPPAGGEPGGADGEDPGRAGAGGPARLPCSPRYPHQSAGARAQRLVICRALLLGAGGAAAGRATTFLDIAHQLELAETARTLAGEGKAVVMVLHDLNLALSCAHRVAVLEEGQLRRVGAPEEIYASGVLEKVFQVRVHSVETAKGERQYLFSRL